MFAPGAASVMSEPVLEKLALTSLLVVAATAMHEANLAG
jgi:hypothetical protein